jgi:hypothetical protein
VRIYRGSRLVATLLSALVPPGQTTLGWDGGDAADGALRVVVSATTSLGLRKQEHALVLDTTPPVATVLAARRERRGTLVRLRLSERASVALRMGTRVFRFRAGPGVTELWRRVRPATVSVSVTDLAGIAGASRTARVR